MAQTAVEWLHEKMIVGKFTGKDTIDFLFETAKEMERTEKLKAQIEAIRAVDTYGIKHALKYYVEELEKL